MVRRVIAGSRRTLAGALLIGGSVGAWSGASAQEALVLSGGGTRGLAHVGVFEALDTLGYDPDIVVGTSMGALMGALYAAGYQPEEIRQRILAVDWNEVLASTPAVVGPDRSVRYPLLSMDLDLRELRGARGLVPQWRINRALAGLLFDANARAQGDFDRLARRYRAVATDLKTGDAVVLSRGDLARAARASMAVPGVFAPVRWDERVLVDGGLVDNLPTGVARGLGAEHVVAVDVGRPTEEIHSLAPLAVIGRALDLIQENTQRDPIAPDHLVAPDISPDFTAATFPADPRFLFDLGREAARRELPPSPTPVASGGRPLPLAPDSLHGLIVEAPDEALEALGRRIFGGVAPGRYDPAAVLAAVDRLYTTGLFEAVWPEVVEDSGAGGPVLRVRMEAQPRTSLSAAAGYENDRGARAWVAIDRNSRIGRLPATLSASASSDGLERWVSAAARLYPLNRPAFAWSIGAQLKERDARIFLDDALGDVDVVRAGGWAGLELPHILSDRVAVAVVRAEWITEEGGRDGLSYGPMLRITSHNPDILIVGDPLLVEGEVRWGGIGYSRLALRGSRVFALGRTLLAPMADLRLTDGEAPPDVLPALGDGHGMPGFQWGEERGRHRALVGIEAAHPVLMAHLRMRLRYGAVSDLAREWHPDDRVAGAQLAFVWRHPLTLIEWGFGANTSGGRRFDISLGRRF